MDDDGGGGSDGGGRCCIALGMCVPWNHPEDILDYLLDNRWFNSGTCILDKIGLLLNRIRVGDDPCLNKIVDEWKGGCMCTRKER